MRFPSRSCLALSALLAGLVDSQATQTVSSVPAAAPTVDLGYASYLGYTNDTAGITYFRGIQYAQPPTGSLRWQKPHAIEAGNDFDGALINATQIAPACYQSLPESINDGETNQVRSLLSAQPTPS